MRLLAMLLLALVFSSVCSAAPPILWETQYPIGFDSGFSSCIVCPDSTLVIEGNRYGEPVTRRLGPNGGVLASNQHSRITDPIALPNSDIIAIGGTEQGVVARYDFNLNEVWSYQSPGLPILSHLRLTADEHIAVLGYLPQHEGAKHIITFSVNGELISGISVHIPSQHTANDMIALPDGNFLLCGMRIVGSFRQGFITKINRHTGQLIWMTYTSQQPELEAISPHKMYLMPDGNIRVIVESYALLDFPHLLWLNKDGDIFGSRYVTDALPNGFDNKQVCTLRDGGFLIRSQWELFRLDAWGSLIWHHDYHYEFDSSDISFGNVTAAGLQRIYWVGKSWVGINNYGWVACLGDDTEPLRVEAVITDEDHLITAGESFAWIGHIRNSSDEPRTMDIWTVARDPEWDVIDPVRVWSDVTIQPDQTLGASLLQHVPVGAISGEYNYILRVGEYPEYQHEAWFSFEVEAAGNPRLQASTGLSGWDLTVDSWELVSDTQRD
jgi:hypothetical protein